MLHFALENRFIKHRSRKHGRINQTRILTLPNKECLYMNMFETFLDNV